jgi:hypothetical protein
MLAYDTGLSCCGNMLTICPICLVIHRQLPVARPVIAHNMPGDDMQLSYHNEVVIVYRCQLLLQGVLPVVGPATVDCVLRHDTGLSSCADMSTICPVCLAIHWQLLIARPVIAHNLPGNDIQLACHNKVVIFYQHQLLLHKALLIAGSRIADNVPSYGI